jgi:hypothetical protein
MLASTLHLDVLRARLSYVYHTYLKDNFPGDDKLDAMRMSENEFEKSEGSVSLAEGFDIWILMCQLYDMAPTTFKTVSAPLSP